MAVNQVSEQLLAMLKAKQQELSTRIEAITKDFQKGRSADFAEQTTESENDQVLEEIRFEARQELKQVNRAIERVRDDEYGMCIKCGDDIAQGRLDALPYTDFCIHCAD